MSLLNTGPRVRSALSPAVRDESYSGRWAWRRGLGLADRTGKFTEAELRRRAVHIGPGFFPFVLALVPHGHPFPWHLQTTVALITLGLGVGVYLKYAFIRRHEEDHERLTACGGYAGSVLLTLLFFPAHPQLAMTVLTIIAFGDGCATMGGLLWGGQTLPWNQKKTIVGSICFLIAGTVMATLTYWVEAQHAGLGRPPGGAPALLETAFACSVVAVLAAALAESLPSRVNDNVRVGLTASVTLVAAQTLFVGWI